MPAPPWPEERRRSKDRRADEDCCPEERCRMDRPPPRHEVREEGRRGCARDEERPYLQYSLEAAISCPWGAALTATPQQPPDDCVEQYLPEFEHDEENAGIVADRLSRHILLGQPRPGHLMVGGPPACLAHGGADGIVGDVPSGS